MVCPYWFFNHGLKSKDSAFNNCHDLTMMYPNISYVTIITVKGVAYLCIIHKITKSEAINLFKKYVPEERRYT